MSKPATNGHLSSFVVDLKAARLARGWSQDTLAAVSGYSHNHIHRCENGHTNPGAHTLEDLAGALGKRWALVDL